MESFCVCVLVFVCVPVSGLPLQQQQGVLCVYGTAAAQDPDPEKALFTQHYFLTQIKNAFLMLSVIRTHTHLSSNRNCDSAGVTLLPGVRCGTLSIKSRELYAHVYVNSCTFYKCFTEKANSDHTPFLPLSPLFASHGTPLTLTGSSYSPCFPLNQKVK